MKAYGFLVSAPFTRTEENARGAAKSAASRAHRSSVSAEWSAAARRAAARYPARHASTMCASTEPMSPSATSKNASRNVHSAKRENCANMIPAQFGSRTFWNPAASRAARSRTRFMNSEVSTSCTVFFEPPISDMSMSTPSLLDTSFMARLMDCDAEEEAELFAALSSAFSARSFGSSSFMRISLETMRS